MIKTECDDKLKIGIIGLGRMGLMHAAVFNSLPISKLVAVADTASFPSHQLGIINPNVTIYKDSNEMLDKEMLDGVLIASPVFNHISSSLSCLEKDIPFLVEKPLSLNCVQALPLIELLKRKKTTNMVGYVYRFQNSFSKAKEILDSNCLGAIRSVKANIYISQIFQKGKGWRYDHELSGGGVLISLGSHVIDLLTWYLGNVHKVSAYTKSLFIDGIEDFAHVILEHNNGVHSILDTSWSLRFKRKIDVKIQLSGENGELIVTDDEINLFLENPNNQYLAGKTVFNAVDLYKPVLMDIGTPKFTFQNMHFLESILNKSQANPNIMQGFHVQQIIDASYKSSKEDNTSIKIQIQ
ncbi:MAG: hypothetical protein A2499_03185 [Stygiobacter sp. RIFOXYC12_FULL_38_8]|nr:MAG: hypothetical protein A2279_06180 [Stygiobacter sp. RIFOXYA12_FULL_38_9]OGV06620.1 MAG: hypothetical protein A2299_01385 [Stygiobacter sp. RIFOXYB2_FULL_37_11]OGV11485.1 MAG: hypothetical protein A2237_05365 [Stygiobacter sp. RIFOXYA2_FULL_38_8]OGV15004.1 MAG: hypothetical protein A2440_06550 [Stygiobacter sp. RIFOXYC2_FULL_38_25]OGV22114.1 MAG: hypothetical protein A2499_03185 [Stygiobacter sp. RIFOXYC12_FULL_38_8]OGV79578.1 MAG: hypothetical protein A2X65_18630 [Stygiobacter sp. GWF2_